MRCKWQCNILVRIFVWVVVITQAFAPLSYADINPANEVSALRGSTLAPRSLVQGSPSFSNDAHLIALILSIAKHTLTDNNALTSLPRDMGNMFGSDDPAFRKYMRKLGRASRHMDIVTVPMDIGDAEYNVRTCKTQNARDLEDQPEPIEIIGLFAVQAVRFDKAIRESSSRSTKKISNEAILPFIETAFHLSPDTLKKALSRFQESMNDGLQGKPSSLQMIPTFVGSPTGNERGEYLALDIGGSNLRVLRVRLEKGKIEVVAVGMFHFTDKHKTGTAEELFGFIAGCVKSFMVSQRIDLNKKTSLGFTWSFPVEHTGVASGIHLRWAKGWKTSGVIGNDVTELLSEALGQQGLSAVKVSAVCDDTVGTLIAGKFLDPRCSMGVILGTGTNGSIILPLEKIEKWTGPDTPTGDMAINMEWGNFNLLDKTPYDIELDEASDNKGAQILEKMVSGMYLGEVARLIMKDLIRRGILFDKNTTIEKFTTEDMSAIEADGLSNLWGVDSALKRLGIANSSIEDRRLVKRICDLVSGRSASIAAMAIAAAVTKIDPGLSRGHVVAVDGSLFEKYPGFETKMAHAFREILLGGKADNIELVLTKDGSGIGAAVIAAVAASPAYADFGTRQSSSGSIAEILLETKDTERAIDALCDGPYAAQEIPSVLCEVNNTLLDTFEKDRDIGPLILEFSLGVNDRVVRMGMDSRPSRDIHTITGQTMNIMSWVDLGEFGPGELRLTVDPGLMVKSPDKDSREPSFIRVTTLPQAPKEGSPGIYHRGAEGITKLGDGNILEEAIYDKSLFNISRENFWMYLMIHGFLNVPDGLIDATNEERISTIHKTRFVVDHLPGSIQFTSTGPGHFQGISLDIKYVTGGHGIQYNKIHDENGKLVKVIAQYLKRGTWTIALPGAVDSIENLGDLRFYDFSIKVTDAKLLRQLNLWVDFSKVSEIKPVKSPYVCVSSNRGPYLVKNDRSAPDITWVNGSIGALPRFENLISLYKCLSESDEHEHGKSNVEWSINALISTIADTVSSDRWLVHTWSIDGPIHRVGVRVFAEQIVPRASTSGIETNMDAIHAIYKEIIPAVKKGTTLWHVIPETLIPLDARNSFRAFAAGINRKYSEKIKIVNEGQMEDLESIVKGLSVGGNVVDVALDNERYIENLPAVPMLVFKPKDGEIGNFRQLEGIIAGLRALHIKDRIERERRLKRLYELLTGTAAPQRLPDIEDPRQFARLFQFILPPITIKDSSERQTLQRNMERLIESA